jgi:hypothetical protein
VNKVWMRGRKGRRKVGRKCMWEEEDGNQNEKKIKKKIKIKIKIKKKINE